MKKVSFMLGLTLGVATTAVMMTTSTGKSLLKKVVG